VRSLITTIALASKIGLIGETLNVASFALITPLFVCGLLKEILELFELINLIKRIPDGF
jgi:hypothetical protein